MAAAIDAVRFPFARPLRLNVSGDARTAAAARTEGDAAARWVRRGGGPVWAYTHAGATVPRAAWGASVSVLASVQSTADGPAMLERGYAPAAVVTELPADGRAFDRDGVRWIPCPEQTRGVQCI